MNMHKDAKWQVAGLVVIGALLAIAVNLVLDTRTHIREEHPEVALSDITLEQHLCRELLFVAQTSTDTLMVLQNPVRLAEPCLLTLKVDTTAFAEAHK